MSKYFKINNMMRFDVLIAKVFAQTNSRETNYTFQMFILKLICVALRFKLLTL